MRRSAPSEVEGSHLVACPNCGALNGKTATLCWKCEVELVGPSMDDAAPSLPNFLQPYSEPVSATPTDETRIDQAPRDAAAREPAGSAAEIGPIAPGLQAETPEAPPALASEDSAPAPDPADSSFFAAGAEAVRRKRRKVVSSATVVVGAAVAVSAYFISRQGAVDDMTWRPAGSTEVTGRGSPTDLGSRLDANAESTGRAPAASMPGPAATNARVTGPPPLSVERSVAALDRDPPAAVGAARGNAGEKTELRPSSQSRATPTAAARATTSKRGVSKRAAESPEAAAAIARSRTSRTSTGSEQPPPPHPGPCTPAIAALGLCTPEPTQRRE
jgi:hypothetical protein